MKVVKAVTLFLSIIYVTTSPLWANQHQIVEYVETWEVLKEREEIYKNLYQKIWIVSDKEGRWFTQIFFVGKKKVLATNYLLDNPSSVSYVEFKDGQPLPKKKLGLDEDLEYIVWRVSEQQGGPSWSDYFIDELKELIP